MITRLEPLESGRDTEIDMIEREMEGGVVILQPPDVHEHRVEKRIGDHEMKPKEKVAPKG